MFSISHLNKKYQYDYSVKRSVVKFLFSAKHLNKKDPFQMVAFINCFVTANKWKWDEITYYNCRRLEFIIQEKLPSLITDKKGHLLVDSKPLAATLFSCTERYLLKLSKVAVD